MAVDTDQIMQEAEKLGQLVAQHPAVGRYKQAQRAVAEDADAGRLLADFDRQLETLGRQEQAGMPVTDAQRMQLESLQSRIISHLKIKALNMAQVEFVDLLRRITQTIQRPLASGGAGGGGAGPGAGASPAATGGGTGGGRFAGTT
jgi:cell fate (sporulation/competence/biofilm development) regulator YlbF (YheA/YmcA/DUF963 family)